MKKLLLIASIIIAVYFIKPELIDLDFSSGPSETGVVLFITQDCGKHCENGERLLREKSIDFELVDVHASKENMERVLRSSRKQVVPLLVVNGAQALGYNRDRWTELLANEYGISMLTSSKQAIFEGHFRNNESKIVMYGTAWCPYCKKARKFFESNNIDFLELDVEKSAMAGRNYKTLEGNGYPLIYIGFNRIQGFGPRTGKQIKRLL